MCGIFALFSNENEIDTSHITNCFNKCKSRGPDHSSFTLVDNVRLGFHRLAINGLTDQSNQPLKLGKLTLICNGEIYNYKELFTTLNVSPQTESDCEVILHLYAKYGIEMTLAWLDGVFSFVLVDGENQCVHIARDPLGIRPLFKVCDGVHMAVASEMKSLVNLFEDCDNTSIQPFEPGTYITLQWDTLPVYGDLHAAQEAFLQMLPPPSHEEPEHELDRHVANTMRSQVWWASHQLMNMMTTTYDGWNVNVQPISYFHFPLPQFATPNMDQVLLELFQKVQFAVWKRCANTERPVACLLSGGLDSSLIAALVAKWKGTPIETYSIGLPGSVDLIYARKVAEHIGSNHTEIVVSEEDMISAIPEVIEAIESYDVTTVRASIGNYLVGKYIATHSSAKVIFNGDGSDELFGGYLYMLKCPDALTFDAETRRLLTDIHMYDVLRSDRCISTHGLEPRTPFLDRGLVQFVLSLSPEFRFQSNKEMEKQLLRKCVMASDPQLLPSNVLWRRKEAFSDGVSQQGRSLYQIIQERMSTSTVESEAAFYRLHFDKLYKDCSHVIPYRWMPRFVEATDPSARTLKTVY